MQTTSVQASTASAVSDRTNGGLDAFESEDFFKLLVTELQQQDPLEPTDTGDMISQVSQIRSIELSERLTNVLSQLSSQQHTAGTSELLGKFVTATMAAGNGTAREVSGVVTGVRFDPDGSAVLELDTGESVLAEDVTRITSAPTATDPALAENEAEPDGADPQRVTADPKPEQTARPRSEGLFPWLSLDGVLRL